MNPGESDSPPVPDLPAGGNPPGSDPAPGNIPRGVELLIKKAAVDPEFFQKLVEQRAAAAPFVGIELDASEQAMLAAVSRDQLVQMIATAIIAARPRKTTPPAQPVDPKLAWEQITSERLTGIRPGRPSRLPKWWPPGEFRKGD